ncbi:MAG: hypothetical protein ACREXU_05240 [Gammaproteobacteria bacterium]
METETMKLKQDLVRTEARVTLLDARATLERAIREIDRYLKNFDEAENDHDRARALNWTINYLATGVLGNLRLDRIADQQAELARLANS